MNRSYTRTTNEIINKRNRDSEHWQQDKTDKKMHVWQQSRGQDYLVRVKFEYIDLVVYTIMVSRYIHIYILL